MVTKEMKDAITEEIMQAMDSAIRITLDNIIAELPRGKNSTIAEQIWFARYGDNTFLITSDTPVWSYLNDGTGIYSDVHRGQGLGGRIVPTHGAKTLHFKNAELAKALGFPDENVFLASVKGIRPRWFWERHFETNRFNEVFASI
jgi:hypothetical protein